MQYLIDVAENGVCVKTFVNAQIQEDDSESECYGSSFVFTCLDDFIDFIAEELKETFTVSSDDDEDDEDEDDE